MSTDNLEWWNIVTHESEAGNPDSEANEEVMVCGHSEAIKLLDSDGIGDFIDRSELLEELKELNNIQEASAASKDQNRSEEKLSLNSQLTVKETVILLLGIVTRHQLSGVALDDILAFIHLICPKENRMPKEAREVFCIFPRYLIKIVKHFYCLNKKCLSYVGTMLPAEERCGLCEWKLTEAMFLEIPVQEQIRTVLSGTLAFEYN